MDAAYDDGHFLAFPFGRLDISEGPGPAWYRHLLLRMASDGESWDTLGTFEIGLQYWNGNTQEQLWFGPYSMRAVSDASLFFGTGETFQVARYDSEGRLTRIVRRRYDPRPVTDDMRDRIRGRYLDRLESSPEVNEQILDRIRQEMEGARFAETPPGFVLKAATETRALGLVADEYGVEEVYVYGLEKPGG